MKEEQKKDNVGSLLEFSQNIGVKFNNHHLLQRALTHRSYLNENQEALEDNERLEFLGDAVLDYLVATWLFNKFPEMAEGELTRLRAALVDTNQLAGFAKKLDFNSVLRLGKGEEESGGRNRNRVLCGAFEAFIGALSIDGDIRSVELFLQPLLLPAVEKVLDGHRDKDPKSSLQEWSQGEGKGVPKYVLVRSSGPDHSKTFEMEVWIDNVVAGYGVGSSKRNATMNAARDALKKLNI